jgi:hypothetical protein
MLKEFSNKAKIYRKKLCRALPRTRQEFVLSGISKGGNKIETLVAEEGFFADLLF